ncbi:MAG TPA: GNAT family N-acyltransferase [Gemmatimonadales bacterium]|jgi:putative hemolysin|nr:GNAT family N-acyltransferase [Gemmatimonadales bacterium]
MTPPDPSRPAWAGSELASRELGMPYPSFPALLPPGQVEAGHYVVRFARSAEELDQVERLRFEVFNLELGEGLDASFATGRDHDDLDPWLHHLLIATRDSGEIVGTYRLQTAEMARARQGFYSSGEFDLAGLPEAFVAGAVEVGRACVARGHRNGRVLNLLWRGLALYLRHNRKRYLFGCCSLTSQDPALGLATLAYLEAEGHLHPGLRTVPWPGFGCEGADPGVVAVQPVHIPPLFQSYLNLGAKVLGPPAIDRQFKTIDFLVALDVEALEPHRYRYFFR